LWGSVDFLRLIDKHIVSGATLGTAHAGTSACRNLRVWVWGAVVGVGGGVARGSGSGERDRRERQAKEKQVTSLLFPTPPHTVNYIGEERSRGLQHVFGQMLPGRLAHVALEHDPRYDTLLLTTYHTVEFGRFVLSNLRAT